MISLKMRYLVLLLLFIVMGSINARPQNVSGGELRGQLKSKDDGQPLWGARVTLLYASDSSIATTSFTDKEGVFVLERLKVGDYRLSISYLGYRLIWHNMLITAKDTLIDMGIISMQRTGVNLEVVEIVGIKPPMVMKKDTIEFNADYFNTRENAVVEELLKKLPGIQIESDGSVKVNGEPVKELMIDGKRFFGGDLRLVTRYLTADMIDKVQILDGQSDWSQFTGINSGQTEKVINLTIKKDSRGKYVGQASAGLGTLDHFAVKSHVTRLSEAQQSFLLVSGNNINGYTGFGGPSRMSIGGNSEVRNWTVGGNHNKDFGEKLKVGGNYSMNNNFTAGRRNSDRQNLLPDTTWYYKQNTHSQGTNISHALDLRMVYQPDTMHVLHVATIASYVASSNFQENGYTSLGEKTQLLNTGIMRMTNTNKAPSFSTIILFGKKFRKAGRTFSIRLDAGYNINDQQGLNQSRNLFVESGGSTFTDTIDQRNDINSRSRGITLSLIYMEPLIKDHYLELSYSYIHNYASSDRSTYNYDPLRKEYDQWIDSLSNVFVSKSSLNQGSIKILNQKNKYDYNIGLNILFTGLNNNNVSGDNRLQQRFVNVFPSAGFNYSISAKKRLQFSYMGSIQSPSTVQLQPVPDNSNPLYVQLGNPDLKPAFNHSFNVSYKVLEPSTMRNFTVGVTPVFIRNKIINATWFDSLGRQFSQPLNVNGAFSINAFLYNGFPVKKLQTSINTVTLLGLTRDVSYINGRKGDAQNLNITQNMSFNYQYKEMFDFVVNARATYSKVRYSVQKDNNTDYLNYIFSFDSNVHLPLNFVIGTNLDYALNTGRAAGYNQDVMVLNGFVAKSLFKRRQALVKLEGFDLLKRNVGINRVVGQYYVEDVQTTVIQRSFLISFSYYLRN